jgi:hypothetical protein
VTVTKTLRSAVRRIADQDAAPGAHLEVSLRTGAFCSYHPDPSASITCTRVVGARHDLTASTATSFRSRAELEIRCHLRFRTDGG